jgi:hypothetical protein
MFCDLVTAILLICTFHSVRCYSEVSSDIVEDAQFVSVAEILTFPVLFSTRHLCYSFFEEVN